MSETPYGDAYAAALAAVGLRGHEVAAARYRNAVDAAITVLRPHIESEALRKAARDAEKITMVYDQDSDDGWRNWMRKRANEIHKASTETDGCTFYSDGMHQNTESLIPASYAACKCGWRSEFNPDRHA